MRRVYAIVFICLSLAMAAVLRAWPHAPGSADKVDQYVEMEMARQKIPGLALGVYRRGEIVKCKATGWQTWS